MLTREQVDALGRLAEEHEVTTVRYYDDKCELQVGYRTPEEDGLRYEYIGADGKEIRDGD